MKTIDLVEHRSGEWVQPSAKRESYWRYVANNWPVLLAVHIPGFAITMAVNAWLSQ